MMESEFLTPLLRGHISKVRQMLPSDDLSKIPLAQGYGVDDDYGVQTERNRLGSETDLNGLVANILDEQDKAQAFLDGGFCSSILKSAWPYHINSLSENYDLFPDFKQSDDLINLQKSLYGTEPVLSTELQHLEDLDDFEQDEHWLYKCQTDTPHSYNTNTKINPHGYSHLNNFLSSETTKDSFQKRDPFVSTLNKSYFEDVGRYNMSAHGKTMHNKRSVTGFQDVKSCMNFSPELPVSDADTYSNFLQAKQNCQTFDDYIPDQTFTIPMTAPSVSDRSFLKDFYVSQYDHKPEFGMKTLYGNNMAITDHFQRYPPKQELQNSDFTKFSSFLSSISSNNSDKLSWTNGQMERNSQNVYNNDVKSDNMLSISQKNPAVVSNYLNVRSPLVPGSSAQKFHSENPTYSSIDYGYNSSDKPLGGFQKATEDHKFKSVAEKRLKTLNGICENVSSLYSPLDRNVKKAIPEKKQNMSFSIQDNPNSMVQNHKELFSSSLSYSNLGNVSVDNKTLNSSKLTHPQSMFLSNGLMMGGMGSNLSLNSLSNFRPPFSSNLGHRVRPMIDCHDLYSYENQSQAWSQINDLLHGDASLQRLAAILSTQKSVKPRNIPGYELHVRLDECFNHCRALEKERKKAESLLMKHCPGKKVSTTNNVSVPRLSSKPSRVDRLIVDQLREQARVIILLGKMERIRSSPLHANISTALDRYLVAINNVRTQRKNEIMNTSNDHQKHGRPRQNDSRDVLILASSVGEMAVATHKTRTVLWCALQMTLPKSPPAQSTAEVEQILQPVGESHDQNCIF
ncbi:meiosis-specific coiled-coil domain-containing protein MEIOC [Phyllobates terribilis]|uniref:meiosis-specific coiled-coil domain-containing protein MEIOC n=1 Tax=Phyllobates terribilis TaxID=111132 RepID=UPI003CCAA4E9